MAERPSVNWKTGRNRPATAAARASGKGRKRARGPQRGVCVTVETRADLEGIHQALQALRQTRSWIDELEKAVVIFSRGVFRLPITS